MAGDEAVGLFDHYQAFYSAEHGHSGQFVEHEAKFGIVAFKGGERKIPFFAAEDCLAEL